MIGNGIDIPGIQFQYQDRKQHWISKHSESNKNRTDWIIWWTEEQRIKQNGQKAEWILITKTKQQASAVLVEFHDYKDSVMRVARILRVPTMHSRDIVLQARGIILVESAQIRWFSRWSGGAGWSSRAVAQQRLRVSKLGLKGPSDYHSNEIAAKAASREARGLS
jgi:hypothetical protein